MTKSELTVADSIRARRSMKSFKSDPIPEATLQELVSLMQDAPSSWNFQPTRVVMIRSMVQKEALAAAAWGQKQILEAPVTFVFAVSIRGWEKNMSEILKSGVSSGAWPQKFADWIGEHVLARYRETKPDTSSRGCFARCARSTASLFLCDTCRRVHN